MDYNLAFFRLSLSVSIMQVIRGGTDRAWVLFWLIFFVWPCKRRQWKNVDYKAFRSQSLVSVFIARSIKYSDQARKSAIIALLNTALPETCRTLMIRISQRDIGTFCWESWGGWLIEKATVISVWKYLILQFMARRCHYCRNICRKHISFYYYRIQKFMII